MNYLLFIVTFFPISLMPGINMTYSMSIGMSLGYARAADDVGTARLSGLRRYLLYAGRWRCFGAL